MLLLATGVIASLTLTSRGKCILQLNPLLVVPRFVTSIISSGKREMLGRMFQRMAVLLRVGHHVELLRDRLVEVRAPVL